MPLVDEIDVQRPWEAGREIRNFHFGQYLLSHLFSYTSFLSPFLPSHSLPLLSSPFLLSSPGSPKIQLGGLASAVSSLCGSGRSPAAKYFLHCKLENVSSKSSYKDRSLITTRECGWKCVRSCLYMCVCVFVSLSLSVCVV